MVYALLALTMINYKDENIASTDTYDAYMF